MTLITHEEFMNLFILAQVAHAAALPININQPLTNETLQSN